jgi:hypothetical protein
MSSRTPEEHRWLKALDSGSLGLWDLDPRLETVHYSPKWKARLGFPRVHGADGTGFWRCRVHPHDFDAMLRALRAHLDGSAPSYEVQFRLRSNGSGYRTVLSRGRVVARDASGAATRMIGTMVDLTDRPHVVAGPGLVTEDPRHEVAVSRVPFHVLLGVSEGPASAWPPGARADRRQLLDQVHDLLDLALIDAGAKAAGCVQLVR